MFKNQTLRYSGVKLALGLSLLLGSAALGGCHPEEAHHAEMGRYPVTQPLKTDTEITREYVAQIRAVQHIEVRALEPGYVDDIFVDEGKTVEKGQKMFQIMPMLYQAELRRSGAEAEVAEIEYRNTRSLQQGNVVSENELAMARARLDKAKAERAVAQTHLTLTEVRAPFDGRMGRLEVRKGSLVGEGELLTTLADNSQMWVYFNLNEVEYLDYMEQVKEGDEPLTVTLRMANDRVFAHEGKVETIEADFNNETGNIAFRATFPNPEGLLRHGETGKVIVTTPLKGVLLVPQKATFDILDKKLVFVVDESDVVHAREITVAEELPHLFVVSGGVGPEDRILLEGLRKVRDGDTIEVEVEAPEAVLSNLELHAE